LEGFGVADGEGEAEEAGEEDSEGEGEDLGLERREGFSEGVGEGEASRIGFTGPVGLRGGAGFGVGVGEGDGDVAATTIAPARQNSSAKMNRRDLMGAAARPP
jgi:hypothetical protein